MFCRLGRIFVACAVLTGFEGWVVPAAAEAPSAVSRNAPFEPLLVEGNDPLCGAFLADVRQQFHSQDELSARKFAIAGMVAIGPLSGGGPIGDAAFKRDRSTGQYTVSLSDGSKIFLRFVNDHGCGGACETERIQIASKADFEGAGSDVVTTTRAAEWFGHRDAKGSYYLAAIDEGFLEVHRLAETSQPSSAVCRISVEPQEASLSAAAVARAPLSALTAMDDAANVVAGPDGECGTSQGPAILQASRRNALRETLYRPWGLHAVDSTAIDAYKRGLADWSLGGLYQHRAFKRFQSQRETTAKALAAYYQSVLGWDANRAHSTATAALDAALASGFFFTRANPYPVTGERALRRALLEQQPLAEIRALKVDYASLREMKEPRPIQEPTDSVLNLAIENPQALQYLIGQGLNPKQGNDFGKTPLMYAAQYNQLESVKILLDAGADVNARTSEPDDRCLYPLGTSGVTALHYAVRYASADVIRLLVARGADAIGSATGVGAGRPDEWLTRYAPGAGGQQVNRNLGPADVPELQKLLRQAPWYQPSKTP